MPTTTAACRTEVHAFELTGEGRPIGRGVADDQTIQLAALYAITSFPETGREAIPLAIHDRYEGGELLAELDVLDPARQRSQTFDLERLAHDQGAAMA